MAAMITRIQIRNFKRLVEADVELGQAVVLIGPNNSGKTTTLQALALWDVGLRQWMAKRGGKASPEKRPGVTINRRDLISIPVPIANLLWRDLHVRGSEVVDNRPRTRNILIEIVVDGVTEGTAWRCGLEFDYANEESFYCRPLRLGDGARMDVPVQAGSVQVAYLPPMSGLAATEPKWEPGRVNVLMGEGQTAQVLRNMCYQIHEEGRYWGDLVAHLRRLFGVELKPPVYIRERGELTMTYRERSDSSVELDLSSSGRGLQQTILLLAHLYANPGTVLLLDEPDAHLEVLRQRQTYSLVTEIARRMNSQIIAASHSEIVLGEAADRDIVIAFIGRPHRIDDRGSQALKALKDISFDHYYQAEQRGWVLYLEGATDLAILQAFARMLNHPAAAVLEQPFVHYVANQPNAAASHFYGVREAKPDLRGIAVFDRIDRGLPDGFALPSIVWPRREIENYLCYPEVLLGYAKDDPTVSQGGGEDLFAPVREQAMNDAITELAAALATLGRPAPWSPDLKVTDEFLDRVFEIFFQKLDLPPNLMRKTDYHTLVQYLPPDKMAPEIGAALDRIYSVAMPQQAPQET
jgi:ABC-type taurine transport system ATPase subunit